MDGSTTNALQIDSNSMFSVWVYLCKYTFIYIIMIECTKPTSEGCSCKTKLHGDSCRYSAAEVFFMASHRPTFRISSSSPKLWILSAGEFQTTPFHLIQSSFYHATATYINTSPGCISNWFYFKESQWQRKTDNQDVWDLSQNISSRETILLAAKTVGAKTSATKPNAKNIKHFKNWRTINSS